MKALRNTLALMLVALLFQQTILAQLDSWEQVKQIKTGKKVQVRLFSGKTVNSKMEAWSADGLTVRQRDQAGSVTLAKSDVAEIVALGMSRRHKALIGFLVGGGGGVTTMAIDCAGHAPKGEICGRGSDGPVVFALVGGIGALVGSLFPQNKKVIYRAPASGGSN
jgi:hypothetical protein